MLRKLFGVAVLVIAALASTPAPAPAVDFIRPCQVCEGGSGPGCRDLKTGFFTSCSSWWASHSGQCR